MTAWFNALSVREKGLVVIAAFLTIIFLFGQFVVQPARGWKSGAEREYQSARTGYNQVVRAARLRDPIGGAVTNGGPAIDRSTPLKTAIAAAASEARLIISSADGDDQRGVEITLAPADAERVFDWLQTIEQRYGGVVREARISRSRANPALVRVDRLEIVRPSNGAS